MSIGRKFTDAADAMSFLQAGNSTLTIVSTVTDTRHTYRVRESDNGKVFFVYVMFGPDNESDFRYIGYLRNGEFRWTEKSKVLRDDIRFRAFDWLYGQLSRNLLPPTVEVWHEGKCGRCGRKLTVPESIARGIGPECWGKHALKWAAQWWMLHQMQFNFDEAEMQRMEAEGDREQTIRDEQNKHEARKAMERN